MEYFAGFFDAEGWVSLIRTGKFNIGVSSSNEAVPKLFQETFGGNLYRYSPKGKKRVYQWCIATNNSIAMTFINRIMPYCIVKQSQLNQLRLYLDQTRENRSGTRAQYVATIAALKKPVIRTKDEIQVQTTKEPDQNFFKWLAGFLDGDGNFTVYEYQSGKHRTFDSWISVFNTVSEPIIYVKERIDGSISRYKGTKFPVWKWVCNQKSSQFVCDSLYPYLIIKKEQCRLVSDYLKIHATKVRGIDHPDHVIADIRQIIKQIKYHNSL